MPDGDRAGESPAVSSFVIRPSPLAAACSPNAFAVLAVRVLRAREPVAVRVLRFADALRVEVAVRWAAVLCAGDQRQAVTLWSWGA